MQFLVVIRKLPVFLIYAVDCGRTCNTIPDWGPAMTIALFLHVFCAAAWTGCVLVALVGALVIGGMVLAGR